MNLWQLEVEVTWIYFVNFFKGTISNLAKKKKIAIKVQILQLPSQPLWRYLSNNGINRWRGICIHYIWIKDQMKITLQSAISPLQLLNFVSCGRACPTKFRNCRGKIVDNRSLIHGSNWSGVIKAEPVYKANLVKEIRPWQFGMLFALYWNIYEAL